MGKYYLVYKNGKITKIFSAYMKEEFNNAIDCYNRLSKLKATVEPLRGLKIYKDKDVIDIKKLDEDCMMEVKEYTKSKRELDEHIFRVKYKNEVVFKLCLNKKTLLPIIREVNHKDILTHILLDETFYAEYVIFNESISLLPIFNDIDNIGLFLYELFKECINSGVVTIDYF